MRRGHVLGRRLTVVPVVRPGHLLHRRLEHLYRLRRWLISGQRWRVELLTLPLRHVQPFALLQLMLQLRFRLLPISDGLDELHELRRWTVFGVRRCKLHGLPDRRLPVYHRLVWVRELRGGPVPAEHWGDGLDQLRRLPDWQLLFGRRCVRVHRLLRRQLRLLGHCRHLPALPRRRLRYLDRGRQLHLVRLGALLVQHRGHLIDSML